MYEVESLMQTFGSLRLDVENCVRELVDFGVAQAAFGTPMLYAGLRPAHQALADLLDGFLERRPAPSAEDRSPSVQRFREMIGHDEKMLIVFEWIRTAAKSDISVLILGPTGSGKEVVARMIHELSRRRTATLQAVNCGALPDTLFESEIFGYEKGAFTGADDRKPGRLEIAHQGTLFLDEIADTSLIAQAKLLRVLEERRFERLGGNQSISVDFRLISATNRPLEQFVRDGRFREDLYYRINAFAIRLPSLHERQVDIPVLAQRFLARYCAAQALPLGQQGVLTRGTRTVWRLPMAGEHPRARKRRLPRRAVLARPDDPSQRRRLPPRDGAGRRGAERSIAVARRGRARAHRAGARRRGLEQEGGGGGAPDQPRHVVSEDRRVRARTRSTRQPGGAGSRTRVEAGLRRASLALVGPIRPQSRHAGPEKRRAGGAGDETETLDPRGGVVPAELEPDSQRDQRRADHRRQPPPPDQPQQRAAHTPHRHV